MAEISFNSVFDAVTLRLREAFPAVQIHGGSVKQGLQDGDFNVIIPVSTHIGEMGIRARREPLILVRYYPSTAGGYAECAGIADQLTVLLGSVTTPEGDVIHGGATHWEVTEGVLHFSVTYRHFVFIEDDPPDKMETLQTPATNFFD